MAEKSEEYNNISVEEMVKKLREKKHEIIEAFAKAYLAESGLMPSEVELCCQETRNGNLIEHVYFFRRKQT